MRSSVKLLPCLVALAASAVACAATPAEDDDVGAVDAAVITSAERAFLGAYHRADAASPVLGLYTKDPTRNYAFEKKIVVTIDVDATKFPGLCPAGKDTCMEARLEAELSATATRVTLKDTRPTQTWPQAAPLFGTYAYTRTATSLELRKVGAPNVVWKLAKGATYCGQSYDCNFQRPDDNCNVTWECTAQRTCKKTGGDLFCDGSWRSVTSLGDIAGTWTSSGVAPGSYRTLKLSGAAAPDATSSEGTFEGTTLLGAVVTGQFQAMPENPAIGFANMSFRAGSANDLVMVKGVRLGADGKVTEMQMQRLYGMGPIGPTWTYTRQ